jgi:hypothetical protein
MTPSSADLRLKLFHMLNVSSNSLPGKRLSPEDGDSVGDSLRDVAAVGATINTMREAMASTLPWNRSVCAIVCYMSKSNYCSADLKNNPKRAAILSEFIDYCLGCNALNWENKQPFLSTDDLAHAWAAWKAKRAAFFSSGSGQDKKKQAGGGRQKDDICRKFNTTTGCPNSAQNCITFYGTKLRHICNQRTNFQFLDRM